MTSTCQLSRNGSSKTLEEPFVKVEILRRDCPSRSPHFNPLRPCGRRLSLRCGASTPQADFNPLRPCGRRLFQAFYIPLIRPISIHSARVGGDDRRCANHALANDFNPLHPCGRRLREPVIAFRPWLFQSTPPVWAETYLAHEYQVKKQISIHSARVGGDGIEASIPHRHTDFNPLRPCGRRRFG